MGSGGREGTGCGSSARSSELWEFPCHFRYLTVSGRVVFEGSRVRVCRPRGPRLGRDRDDPGHPRAGGVGRPPLVTTKRYRLPRGPGGVSEDVVDFVASLFVDSGRGGACLPV